ncbi:uncharacterized protein KY384_002251 [Bacidia gigantensis]|uniref:uncharacterized protein n=1 Tax=Bacidia gigantensis TaxID=2732470 RepID=UPI001D05BAE7|nr:uncharacterized protein KY384_002251 [Bacidia gigantensis]KAG8533468.1 hypothetical protein KY384_002251 [Bacidia gigantensis]
MLIQSAAFNGSRVILRQVSPESETIYDLILSVYSSSKGDWAKLASDVSVSKENLDHFLAYAAQFLGNLGNYKGFGDSKFIPRCPKDTIIALASGDEKAKALSEKCVDAIYEAKPGLMHLGFPEEGHMTNYYPDSPDISQSEIEEIDRFTGEKGLLPENTRIKKLKDGNFEILIASGITNPPPQQIDTKDHSWTLPNGRKVSLVFGDHQEELAKAAIHMKLAAKHAANDTEKAMLAEYAKSYSTGSLLAFKESQKLWVDNVGPAVETNIGFIETYRDPAGVRAEWEGLVAIVNKEQTRKFKRLVDAAPEALPKLPWGKNFEKDEFQPPDFTSLEVLSFPSSGIPVGINIPNYDDIRQTHGFKNVSLANILSAKAPSEPIPFIAPADLALYTANRDTAFEIQVGLHELLGHGSGKLLQETSPGNFNFDRASPPISPITNKPVETWYKPGETWSSVFGAVSSSYEECRAECVAMSLACDFDIAKIFGLDTTPRDGSDDAMDSPAGDVLYASYLSMARAGVASLEFFSPEAGKWGQAHMQARFSILKAFLGAGDGFCVLETTPNPNPSGAGAGFDDITIKLDKAKILTHGKKAVDAYLRKLHTYKSTADVVAGKKLYEEMTAPEPRGYWIEGVRPCVLRRKVARKVFVMGSTRLNEGKGKEEGDGEVELVEYEASVEGMIRSWAERGI